MKRMYIDLVSSAPPRSRGEDYEAGPVRIAFAVEDEKEIVAAVVRLITPASSWYLDAEWMARYGVNLTTQAATVLPEQVGQEFDAAVEGVSEFVAHFSAFHIRQLNRLLPAGASHVAAWFDTMSGSSIPVGIVAKNGGFKSPKLTEAVLHFTGTPLPPFDGMDWRQAALATLTGVRQVYWGLNSWGLAPPIVEVAP